MQVSIKRFFQFVILLLFLFGGCSTQVGVKRKSGPLFFPVGVDSLIAVEADSIAQELFVTIEEEKKAEKSKNKGQNKVALCDTLWKYLSMEKDSTSKSVSPVDSLAAIEEFNKGAEKLKQAVAKQRSGADEKKIKAEMHTLLEEARLSFEKAVVLNPFDLEAKSWLATVYKLLAVRLGELKNHEKSIKVLENLVHLERGEHTLFARLGENYWQTKDWRSSYRNFVQAEKVLTGISFIAKPDTGTLFLYVYYQGDNQAKMYDADSALFHFSRAISFAPNDEQIEKVQSYISWINWDDGNIAASERKDEILQFERNKQYKKAAKEYEKLISQLKTQRAENEIHWRLSLIEFEYLEKEEDGIDRLSSVIKQIDVDEKGVPTDSTNQRYIESFGVMCHNLGLANEQKNRKVALAYFLQSISIPWENRSKSLLELAKLSKNDPDRVIEYCTDSLEPSSHLSREEKIQVYQLLVEAYKRKGMFEKARQAYQRAVELKKEM